MNKRIIFFFLLTVCCFAFSYPQSNSRLSNIEDSLLKLISSEKSDTVKAHFYNELAFELRRNNPAQALVYGNNALDIGKKYNNTSIIALAYLHIGTASMNLSRHNEAIQYLKNAISWGLKSQNKKTVARAYNNTGIIFLKQGNNPEALKNYLLGLKLRQEMNDRAEMGSSFANIGNVYYKENKLDEALKNYKIAVNLFENTKSKFGMANALSNIGNVYAEKGMMELALEYFNKALAVNQEIGDRRGISSSFNHIGSVYLRDKKYELAKDYLNKALEIEIETENYDGSCETKMNIARIDLEQGNLDEAEKTLLLNINELKRIKNISNLSESYFLLSTIDTLKKDFKKAFYHYNQFIAYRDSVINKQNSEKILQQQLTFEFNKKENEARQEQMKKDIITKEELRRQKTIIYISLAAIILVLFFLGVSVRAYKGKQRANHIIVDQKKEVENQKMLLDIKQKEIIDSINYAKRIQYTLLAHHDLLFQNLGEHFVLFLPKDIVSGDFYWATKRDNRFYLAVCDSTGHGVPGAFMSLLNISFLNEAINEKMIVEPNAVLNHVRERLIEEVSRDGAQDGMDAVLICFELAEKSKERKFEKITYASANNGPVLIRDKQLLQLECDKMPVGKGERNDSFSLYTLHFEKGDSLYLYTDGYADQFGGPKGKKFKYKQLNELLTQVSRHKSEEQQNILQSKFIDWKGNLEQVDDVCLIGIKIP